MGEPSGTGSPLLPAFSATADDELPGATGAPAPPNAPSTLDAATAKNTTRPTIVPTTEMIRPASANPRRRPATTRPMTARMNATGRSTHPAMNAPGMHATTAPTIATMNATRPTGLPRFVGAGAAGADGEDVACSDIDGIPLNNGMRAADYARCSNGRGAGIRPPAHARRAPGPAARSAAPSTRWETGGMARSSFLAPLGNGAFRMLWIVSLVSNIGTWMQTVGAQWLLLREPDS